MKLRAKLATRIRQLRIERGLTQAEIAKRCQLQVNTLNRIENNPQNLTIDKIESIAKALGVSVADFFIDDKKAELDPSDEFEILLRRFREVKKKLMER